MVKSAMPPYPTARRDVELRRVGSEWVLFDARRERAHVLNLTAAVVWTYCDGLHGTEQIVAAIRRQVAGADQPAVPDDIQAVLQRFAAEGLFQ